MSRRRKRITEAEELVSKGSKAGAKELADSDYWSALSADEKRFLRKFEQEYYFNTFSDEPLHSKRHSKDIYADDYRRRNSTTADSELPANLASASPMDALIEAIDRKYAKKPPKKS